MIAEAVHIVPANGGWTVRGSGDDEPNSQHRIQLSAIMIGRCLAESLNCDLLIYGRDGQVRRKISSKRPTQVSSHESSS